MAKSIGPPTTQAPAARSDAVPVAARLRGGAAAQPARATARLEMPRLAPRPRRQRQPDGPPLRLLPPDRLSLAGALRPPSPRDARGPQLRPAPPTAGDAGRSHQLEAVQAAPRTLSALGQGQARRPPPSRRDPPVDLDGRPDPRRRLRRGDLREPPGRRISVRKRLLAAAVRHPPAGRLAGRPAGRPGRARHARHPATRGDPSVKQFTARDRVSRWDVLELARRPTPARPPRSSTPSPSGCPSRSGPSASTTARSSWPSSRPPARPAASRCSSCRRAARSCTARSSGPTGPTPRSSTRSPTPPPDLRRPPGRAAGLGDHLQHDPAPPGPRLSHPGRVPGLVGVDV